MVLSAKMDRQSSAGDCLAAKMDLPVLSAKIDLNFDVFTCENGSRGGFTCENGTKGKRMFLSAKMD